MEKAANALEKTISENEKDGYLSSVNLEENEECDETSVACRFVHGNQSEEHSCGRGHSIEEGTNNEKIACNSKRNDSTFSEKKAGIEVFFSGKNISEEKQQDYERRSRNPYQGCEIDSSVLESLPDEIRQEIEQSLLRNNQQVKKTKERTHFFGPRMLTSEAQRIETSKMIATDGSSDSETRVSVSNRVEDRKDLRKCEKCGETLPAWEMPEHLDYHFALELQEGDSNSTVTSKSECFTKEPPKKRQRTTIHSFFTPK